MRLIPTFLQQKEFEPLKKYLASSPASEQQKLYQLSLKVADLFDQYLVYRPEWIAAWEENNDEKILDQINQPKQGLSALILPFFLKLKAIFTGREFYGEPWWMMSNVISVEKQNIVLHSINNF